MNRFLAVLALVVVLGGGASAAGAQSRDRWPKIEERSFLVNCAATSGGRVGVCTCALRWLEQRYTYRQIATIYLRDPARLRRILVRAVTACR